MNKTEVNTIFYSTQSGKLFLENDKNSKIIFEWEIIDPKSMQLSQKIEEVSDLLIKAYTQIESEFAKEYPDAIPNEMFLKPLAHNFGQDKEPNWQAIQTELSHILKDFLIKQNGRNFLTKKIFIYLS